MHDQTGDRRPIAARDLRPVQAAAYWLIARQASPNVISVLGMLCASAAALMFTLTSDDPSLWLIGAVLVQLRLLANLLDGMVAVGRGMASRLGELFNEVPDRVSDTVILVGMGVAARDPALGLGAALAAMATAYIRAVGKGMGLPSDFCGPGAKQQRMAVVTMAAICCGIMPQAFRALVPDLALWAILVLATVTAGRRLLHLARALRS